MREIRFHGKGGQGTVQACRLLAKVLILGGRHAQFIPAFGVERKGSPVYGYFRISDDRPIRSNSQVYHPDLVVVMDDSLLHIVDVFKGVVDGGELLINTKKDVTELDLPATIGRIGRVDAFGIAAEVIGRDIPNTTMLGAIAAFVPGVDAESLFALVGGKFGEKNVLAARRGFAELQVGERATA